MKIEIKPAAGRFFDLEIGASNKLTLSRHEICELQAALRNWIKDNPEKPYRIERVVGEYQLISNTNEAVIYGDRDLSEVYLYCILKGYTKEDIEL